MIKARVSNLKIKSTGRNLGSKPDFPLKPLVEEILRAAVCLFRFQIYQPIASGSSNSNQKNSGFIDPNTASELALEFGIRVYTIGVGSNGMALSPTAILPNGRFQYGNVPVEIDEELLTQIASTTGGKYFRATDNEKLEAIYEEIDALEKTEIEEFRYYNYDEKYRPLVLLAGGLLLLEVLLRMTVFRSFV